MSRPNEKINIEHVGIQTSTLSISHMMVDNRKMTLSVFRQIIEEDLIDPSTYKLNGVPWGKINYFWGDMRTYDVVHVVWQKGKELRRFFFGKPTIDGYISALFNPAFVDNPEDHFYINLDRTYYWDKEGPVDGFTFGKKPNIKGSSYRYKESYKWKTDYESEEALKKDIFLYDFPKEREKYKAQYLHHQKRLSIYEDLMNLQQIYIAV